VNVPAGTNQTGFVDDSAIYLRQPFPSLQGTLPNTDPSSANYQSSLLTTARDANALGMCRTGISRFRISCPSKLCWKWRMSVTRAPGFGGQYAFSDLHGLPSKLLSMGDILNDPVSLHPHYTAYARFDTSPTVARPSVHIRSTSESRKLSPTTPTPITQKWFQFGSNFSSQRCVSTPGTRIRIHCHRKKRNK